MQTTASPNTVLPPDWNVTLTHIERQIETCLAWVHEHEAVRSAELQPGSLKQINERVSRIDERLRELGEIAKRSNSAGGDIDAQLERGEESMRIWLAALDTVQKAVAVLNRKYSAEDHLQSEPRP